MKRSWPFAMLLLASLMLSVFVLEGSNGVEATLEDDEYSICVDDDDDDWAKLEIHGEFDPGLTTIGQRISVSLTSVINEMEDGTSTGRTWYSEIEWDDSALTSTPRLFDGNDGPEGFTVYIDPDRYDPGPTDESILPVELSLDIEGRLLVTASFTGIGVPDGTVETRASSVESSPHFPNLVGFAARSAGRALDSIHHISRTISSD